MSITDRNTGNSIFNHVKLVKKYNYIPDSLPHKQIQVFLSHLLLLFEPLSKLCTCKIVLFNLDLGQESHVGTLKLIVLQVLQGCRPKYLSVRRCVLEFNYSSTSFQWLRCMWHHDRTFMTQVHPSPDHFFAILKLYVHKMILYNYRYKERLDHLIYNSASTLI